jgi:hypothetical protein
MIKMMMIIIMIIYFYIAHISITRMLTALGKNI